MVPAPQPLAPKSQNARPVKPAVEGKGKAKAGKAKRPADDTAQDGEDHNPPPKKRKVNTTAKDAKTSGKKSDKESAEGLLDVSGISLPGEQEGTVEVYETCNSLRTQIRAILKKPGMTQAAFCRALGKFAAAPDGKAPAPGKLATFLGKKGVMSGNTNSVFYSSYVLLEKMRIRDGKDKSKFRKEMEEIHRSEGGVDIKVSADKPIFLHVSERAHVDRWGVLHIE
ncbi:hypothetical protein N0V82_003826 [Gnomoniopsis sp. IMI 355080]|nr:hypothetical protein N0V82_003826 [Gnomoniopsis sp. IMI 355080]